MKVWVIWAQDLNGGLGNKNQLPIWKGRADMRNFKQMTMGHPVIMGRRTFDSVKILPGRTNIVLTRHDGLKNSGMSGVVSAPSISSALEFASHSPGSEKVFIIGGASVYQIAFENVDFLHITYIPALTEHTHSQ